MRRIIDFTGGRNLVNDDLEVLQAQLDVMPEFFRHIGPFVISGCDVTPNGGNYDVSAGFIMLNGKIFETQAQTALNLSAPGLMFGETSETTEASRPYTLLSTNKDGIERRNLQVIPGSSSASPGENIYILSGGMRTLRDALRGYLNVVGKIEMYSGDVSVDFDVLGQGKGNLRGWRLCNGVGGSINLVDRFIVGQGGLYAVGDIGGENQVTLSAAQSGMPVHNHAIETIDGASSTGAGSYLLTGDYTVVQNLSTNNVNAQDAALGHENRPPYYALAYMQWVGTSNYWKTV